MPVTLQFVEDRDIIGHLIEYVSHGWPTHVDILWPDGTLFGARPDGVKLRPPDYKVFTRIARITLPTTDEQGARFYAFLNAQIGKPYDFTDVFGFVTGAQEDRKGKCWFCSMLATGALNAIPFFPSPLAKEPWETDPADLLLVCSAFAPLQWIKK